MPTRRRHCIARIEVWIICFAALAALSAFAPGARAQAPVTLSTLDVAVWPEYDKPGLLVIYRGQVSPAVSLPVRLTFAIPASSGGSSSTAGVDAQGQFHYLQPTTAPQGDLLLVSYDNPYATFQFEYYDNPLAGQGPDRRFTYAYRADYPIDALTLEIGQAVGSTGFSITPAATSTQVREGMTFHLMSVGKVAAGETKSVSVSYRKDDNRLAAEILGLPTPSNVPFEGSGATTPAGTSSAALNAQTIIIVAAAVLAILAVVGVTLWSRSRQSTPPPRMAPVNDRPRRNNKKKGGARPQGVPVSRPASTNPSLTGYCHQCGRGLKADEQFCPACGARRK